MSEQDGLKDSKYRIAVGLEYDDEQDEAPTISLKGDRQYADQIVKLAKRFGVPIVENKELAQTLNALEADEEIPEELFEAVAIILNKINQ